MFSCKNVRRDDIGSPKKHKKFSEEKKYPIQVTILRILRMTSEKKTKKNVTIFACFLIAG